MIICFHAYRDAFLFKFLNNSHRQHEVSFYFVSTGLVTVFMAQSTMGLAGSYLVLTMLIMAVMSSGSGEVMAISSIVVYDIYQTHIRPFK